MRLALILLFSAASVVAQSFIDTPKIIALTDLVDDERLGIQINIGGATWTESYLFDTGSYAFMSGWASGAPWWGTATVDSGTTVSAIYGPGSGQNRLDYHPAMANLSVTDGVTTLVSSGSVNQVFAGYTNADPSAPVADWQPNTAFNDALVDAVTTNDPPFAELAGPVFGIFGAGLFYPTDGLYGMLEQFTYGEGISKGYVVSGANPSLTIGLSADRIDDFTATFSMNAAGGGAFDEGIISPDYVITDGGLTLDLSDIPTLLDTGTPPEAGVVIEQGTEVDVSAFMDGDSGYLRFGTTLTMLIAGSPYALTSTSENPISVFDAPNGGTGMFIYGLNFFQAYDVMYDLDTQLVGVVAVPEPAVFALLVLSGSVIWWRRRELRS